jgi:endonuclease/exonuclease/phosphatase family metal-dependent hydrolase
MKIVTYNIQYSRGQDDRFDLPRVAASLQGADIIGLQEVDRFWKRTGMQDQAEALAEMCPGFYWTYAGGYDVPAHVTDPETASASSRGRRRQHGNMVMSRWPILSFRALRLPRGEPGEDWAQDRVLLEAVIDAPSGALRVYVTHMCHIGPHTRLPQVDAILQMLRDLPADGGCWTGEHPEGDYWMDGDGPIPFPEDLLIMGDLNFEPGDEEYARFMGSDLGLVDSWVAAGHDPLDPAAFTIRSMRPPHPLKRLDQIFLSPSLADRVVRAWVDQGAMGSDHFPSWLELSD